VWSSFALDGDSNWHYTARVGNAAELIVLGAEFAGTLETVCHTALTHSALLDAKKRAPHRDRLNACLVRHPAPTAGPVPSSTPHLPQ
jgi:hypothetical protein